MNLELCARRVELIEANALLVPRTCTTSTTQRSLPGTLPEAGARELALAAARRLGLAR
jgi:hypothetical protein